MTHLLRYVSTKRPYFVRQPLASDPPETVMRHWQRQSMHHTVRTHSATGTTILWIIPYGNLYMYMYRSTRRRSLLAPAPFCLHNFSLCISFVGISDIWDLLKNHLAL
jgi:hypothetical protein